jgi:hypothetical protein
MHISIEDSSSVLVVEDSFDRIPWFRHSLPHATIVRHPLNGIDALSGHDFGIVFLDGDLLCPQCMDGGDVAKYLVDVRYPGRVIVHSHNYFLSRRMEEAFRKANITHIRVPFGDFEIASESNLPAPVRVVWEFWREAQQRSYHGESAVVDLGKID